jgi:glycosyltransferase involved in cell wall biosynthesis
MLDVTVVIPTIPPRVEMLKRAVQSVMAQTWPAAAIAVSVDNNHDGAWTNRNRGLAMVQTEWTAFLDDDDELLPIHLERLSRWQASSGADMVWGWFEVVGGTDPFPHYRGRQYNPEKPHIIPITYMARTEMLQAGPGFQADEIGCWDNQDQPVIDSIVAQGGKLFACNDITWRWWHHDKNTSGRKDMW